MADWIDRQGRCALVTDAPEYDFELIRPYLMEPAWPAGLDRLPIRLDSLTVPEDLRDAYLEAREDYLADHPRHHALNDARALREAWLATNGQRLPAGPSEGPR